MRVDPNQRTANYVNTVCCIDQGKYSNQLHRVCYDNRARDCKCLLVFVLRAENNVRNKLYTLISFYAMRILSKKFEGFIRAAYQQIVVYTRYLSNRMDLNIMHICL